MASSTLIFATLFLVTVASAADPTCSTGVKAGIACCPAGCGTCGGPDCGSRSRALKLKCCIGAIKNMDANCLTSDPPCKVTTNDPNFMAGSDTPDPTCAMGLRKNKACCPKECSTCGGVGCRPRGVLIKSLCCPGPIMKGSRGCNDTGAPCALLRGSTPDPEESPMAEPTPVESPTVEPLPTVPPVCQSMRKKFIGGCFCFLLFDRSINIKMARAFRMFCRKAFGTKKKILSQAFACRRFKIGSNAMAKVETMIKRLNQLIPICEDGLPMIEKVM